MDLQRLPRRRTDIPWRDGQTQSVLDDPDQGASYVLNPTARAVWEMCDGTTTVDELADAICQVFSVPRSRAEVEVSDAVERLAGAGLVTWASGDEAPSL